MYIKILVLVYFAIKFTIISGYSDMWCTRSVPVIRTRSVQGERWVEATYYNWIGSLKTKYVPQSYTDTEEYITYSTEYVCCTGYVNTGGGCLPLCTEACPMNSHCSAPDICSCEHGYKDPHNSINTYREDCEPICESGCPRYSSCVRPDECECVKGYKLNENTGVCEPTCSDCPENSYCEKPDECTCHSGYRRRTDDACEPECEPSCGKNGYCKEPNFCDCLSGYGKDHATGDCLPLCSKGCPADSLCEFPEVCQCILGYKMNTNRTECVPECTETCPLHSVCHRPNECLCEEGYLLQDIPGILLHCEAQCEHNCSPHGKCVAPNVCECFDGYTMHGEDRDQPLCQPHCSKGCDNGLCFAPEMCVCNAGFLMGPNNTCTPICSLGCTNGVCVEPEMCVCSPGYRFATNSVNLCEPICDPKCENATCVAPDLCLCWQHYQPEETSGPTSELSHTCVPSCEHVCVNGFCSAPNTCSCSQGHVPLDNADHVCIPATTSSTSSYGFTTEISDIYEYMSTETEKLLPSSSGNFPTSTGSHLTSSKECNDNCKCWQEYDIDPPKSAKCVHTCLDAYDSPCLDLSSCLCDIENLQLLCNTNEFSEKLTKTLYICSVPFSATIKAPSLQSITDQPTTSDTPWLLILICSVIGVAVMGGLYSYMAWRRSAQTAEKDSDDFDSQL